MTTKMFLGSLGPAIALALLWTGCATTPADRIKQNPALFSSFSSEVQEQVQQGKVNIGFTTDMARLALGKPDRILLRKDLEGTTEVWQFLGRTTTTERQRVEGDSIRLRTPDGYYTTSGDFWINVRQTQEYVRMQLEFRNGLLILIEQEQRGASK